MPRAAKPTERCRAVPSLPPATSIRARAAALGSVLVSSALVAALVVGCGVSSDAPAEGADNGELAMRSAGAPEGASRFVLALGGGEICRVSPTKSAKAEAVLQDIAADPRAAANEGMWDDELLRKTRDTFGASRWIREVDLGACDPTVEDWALDSLARRAPAPLDVAALNLRFYAEIKLLIAGGGIAAGLMGDGVGASCMAALNAGLDYARGRGWVTCGR